MKKKELNIGFVQWLLPLYRLGFYKEFSKQNDTYNLTILCPMGEDTVTHIKTISPQLFSSITKNTTRLKWIDTKIRFNKSGGVMWQHGIIKHLLRKDYDVMMMSNQMNHLFYWLLIFICKLRGIKIMFWSHGLQGNETGFKLWLKKKFLGFADVNCVYAEYNKKFLVDAGYDASKIQVVYNSLDVEEQDNYYNEIFKKNKDDIKHSFIKNDYPSVLFVGRLEEPKKVDLLLKAAAILKGRNFFINVIIIGDGLYAEALRDLSSQLGLEDQVFFMGKIYEEKEIVKYFYVADLFVSPGNVGLNCMHALNYGLPIITHNDVKDQKPEFEVLSDKETGMFYKKYDVEDLSNKIEYWLKNHTKEQISEKLRHLVKTKYSPEVQARCVLQGIGLLDKK